MLVGNSLFGSDLLARLASDVGLNLCDVGSRGGTLEDFLPAAAFTNVLGFEPDVSECSRLNEMADKSAGIWKSERHFPTALGDRNAQVELFVCNDPGCSSTLEPTETLPSEFGRGESFGVAKRLPLSIESLDAFCKKNAVMDLDFLKIDVQGGELSILKGGEEMVGGHILGIRCEVEFGLLYNDQPLFSEVEMHLRKWGFYPADWLYERYWRRDVRCEHGQYCFGEKIPYSRGRIIHSDVLFLRDHRWIASKMPDYQTKLCRLMLIALLYHHVDLAAALLPMVQSHRTIQTASTEQWHRELGIASRSLAKIALRTSTAGRVKQVKRMFRSWVSKH